MLWALDADSAYTRERLLPRDTIELLINLGPPHRMLASPGLEARDCREAWISGLQESWLDIESPSNSKLVGVRFLPGGCHRVFGLPVDTLSGRVVDLDDVVGRVAREWRARLIDAPDMETRLDCLESWMTGRLVSADHSLHGSVSYALQALQRSYGSTPIRTLARESGISHKHLIDRFRSQVGLTPKTFARVLRFQALLRQVQHSNDSWARWAYALGYSDQSHLNLEFRAFSGRTPTEFLRARGPDGDSIVLDRDPS
jgi:AraC-like DNA-binding protein